MAAVAQDADQLCGQRIIEQANDVGAPRRLVDDGAVFQAFLGAFQRFLIEF